MPAFHWDNCYVTGIAIVDEQHHRLVDLINTLGESLAQSTGITAEANEAAFGELATYARVHFSDEDALMVRNRIDDRALLPHRQEHADFIREVVKLEASVQTGSTAAGESLMRFLTYWLAYHILGSDQSMARQLASIARGTPPARAFDERTQVHNGATEPLLEAVNGLLGQMSQRNRELEELNRTLESRVAERTRDLQALNKQLEDLAMTDVLTGLPNRRHGLRRLATLWTESSGAGTPLCCLMIDADRFKQVNDTGGHDAGDDVLRRLARHLSHSVRTDDVVCRLGGDEFLVICPQTPLDGALHLAEALRTGANGVHVSLSTGEWRASSSIGVAARVARHTGVEDLMKAADEAVYAAKRAGRNRVATVS